MDSEGGEVIAGDVLRAERLRLLVSFAAADAEEIASCLEGGELLELGGGAWKRW